MAFNKLIELVSELDNNSEITFCGLRIQPKAVFFKNLMEGKTYKEKVRFQNIKAKPIEIQTIFPQPCSFKLENSLNGTSLPSGLTTNIWIKYTHVQNSNVAASLRIYVDDECLHYPINVCMSFSYMYPVPRVINFGTINQAHSIYTETLEIHNKGFKTSKFVFDLANNPLGLLVKPTRGFVEPNSSTCVQISIVGIEEGQFYKEIWVKCDYPFRFAVAVDVVKPKLFILSPQVYTETFLPIQFPATYALCKNFKTLVVKNHNLLESNYIVVPEFHLDVMAMHKVKELEPGYSSFCFLPAVDGHLKPNEKKDLHVSFQGKKLPSQKRDRIFFVCYRLIRLEILNVNRLMQVKAQKKSMNISEETLVCALTSLHVDSAGSDISCVDAEVQSRSQSQEFDDTFVNNHTNTTNKCFNDYIRLCCYAVVKPVQVEVHPKSFELGFVELNCTKTLMITLHNRSNLLPIYFEYVKTAYIDIMPPRGMLDVSQSFEITINISPKRPGILDGFIKFNLLYNSYVAVGEQELIKVGKVLVGLQMNVRFPKATIQPKFNPGITPKFAHEVGFFTQDVKFNSEVEMPKMAMVCSIAADPAKKKDDAKIAFPNDRRRSIVPWSKIDGRCKTVFSGVSRYVAPSDFQYARTSQEELARNKNLDYYDRYINKLYMERMQRQPPPMLPDYYTTEKKLLLKIDKPICPVYMQNSNNPILQGFPALTPSQTYFINVKPLKVNLGKIAVDSTSVFRITVSNDNKFPCHIELKTLHMDSFVFPSLPKTTILKASLSTLFEEVFNPNVIGKFHTILNFMINNRHSLPITFEAEIVKPFVYLETHSIIFDDKNESHSRYVKLINVLNIPVIFYWQIPKLICYSVQPAHGCIPVGRFIMCEIIYEPDAMKRSNAKLQCCCPEGSTNVLEINAYLLKCDVEYLRDRVAIDNIPINIPVIEYNTLRNNATEAVSFTIRNTKPCYGVSIEPAFGTIRGRSDFVIKIIVHFKFFAKFECKVETEFERGNYLIFLISGIVDFPKLRVKPDNSKFSLKRIPAESFDVCPFSLLNKGNCELILTFDQVLFPDIKISKSPDFWDITNNLEVNLGPDQMIQLYVHFYPLDVSMNDILVPVIINYILGPPYKGEFDTLKSLMYVNDFIPPDVSNSLNENIQLIKGNTNILPIIPIYAISSRHVLRFNKTFFKFKYFPLQTYPTKTIQELKIKNSFHKPIEFSLNLDGIYPHFEVTPNNNKKWNYNNNFIYYTAEPNEDMVLKIRFRHKMPGLVTKQIEVHIKDVKNGAVFTYIKLRGRYLEATFKIPLWIFLEPVPLRVVLQNEVKLKLRNHFPDCKISITCDDLNFMVTEIPNKVDYSLLKDIIVRIEFVSDVVKQICTKIYFTCSCGAKAHTIVTASADDNIATIYTHLYKNSAVQPTSVKSKYFPLFPSKRENTKQAIYMRKCKTIVERWIYEQVTHMTYYYFIPDSMMGLYKCNMKSKNPKPDVLALVKIMQNLCGNEVNSFIFTRPYPSTADRIEQINYKHSVFKNVLQFLKSNGAFFPHVRARYLLDYSEYTIYCTKVRAVKQKKLIEYDEFDEHYLRSEQCWLDLILQLFKTIVLSSITFRKQRISHVSEMLTLERILDTDSQQALLNWLNELYENQINVLMELDKQKPPDFVLPPRNIINFTSDLEDGLVLTAITMHYCPYLKFILKDIYVKIDSPDKSYHNAILLIQAWSMVKCSFKILPEEITNPSALQMLLFVTYMYQVFPLLVPKEELTFDVSLSFMESREIFIKNPTTSELMFEISFLNNTMDCFQIIPCNLAVVPPMKELRVKVIYQAKRMKNITAVLVLSGDTPGQQYCKSIIYILKGITNFAKVREKIVLNVDLYSITARDILFRAPYEYETTYDIIKDNCKLENFNVDVFNTWKETPTAILPKSLHCSNCTMTTNEMGIGTVKMTISCLSIAVEQILLVFINNIVGDFIVTLIIQPKSFQKIPKHIITVQLPDNWDSLICICGKNKFVPSSKCPRYVTVHIPCRNDYFWNIITQSLLLSVPDADKPIWADYLNGEMGPYLLNWLFVTANGPSSSVKHIFESDIKYKVSNPHYSGISFPSAVIIPNMRSNDTVPINVHIGANFSVNRMCDFKLESEDGGEYRIYTLVLKKKKISCLNQNL